MKCMHTQEAFLRFAEKIYSFLIAQKDFVLS